MKTKFKKRTCRSRLIKDKLTGTLQKERRVLFIMFQTVSSKEFAQSKKICLRTSNAKSGDEYFASTTETMNGLGINKPTKFIACLLVSKRVNRVPTQRFAFILSLFTKYRTQNLPKTYYTNFFVPISILSRFFIALFQLKRYSYYSIILLNLYKSQITPFSKTIPSI